MSGLSQDLKIVALSIFGIPSPDVFLTAPTNVHPVVLTQPMEGMALGQGG